MHESWVRRIGRAENLAADGGVATPLLTFYARLLTAQSELYERCRPANSIGDDVFVLARDARPLLHVLTRSAPEALAEEAAALLECGASALGERLLRYWCDRSEGDFFAKAILQPYAQRLAEERGVGDGVPANARRCPVCGGRPQVSVLDVAGRQLLCANCVTPWPFPRVGCASCGEDDEKKLGYYEAPQQPHVRVDACESCFHYIKTIDLARLGLAVPLVDEVAAAPLDLWARDRGYQKIELNLVGL